jgi:hypothetical protein
MCVCVCVYIFIYTHTNVLGHVEIYNIYNRNNDVKQCYGHFYKEGGDNYDHYTQS